MKEENGKGEISSLLKEALKEREPLGKGKRTSIATEKK